MVGEVNSVYCKDPVYYNNSGCLYASNYQNNPYMPKQ